MDLKEQIRYYSAVASHYRRLNYQLKARYQILYASPLQDGRRGLADDIHDTYAMKWQHINDSLDTFAEWKRGKYSQLETMRERVIDKEAANINHNSFVIY
jgi:hypothetical protein